MRFSKLINVVKLHTGGEVNNVAVSGFGAIPGDSVFDKQRWLEANRDDLRKLLLFEPRGAVTHCVNFVVPSNHPEADMGYIIAESIEYPAMSGSNTICTATALLETGILPMEEPITEVVLEAPAGLIRLRCSCSNGKVTGVELTNQPAFVHHLGVPVEIDGIGTVEVDIAWGGMAYVIAEAELFGFDLVPSEGRAICDMGEVLKRAVIEQHGDVTHPLNPDFPGITQAEFAGPLARSASGALTSKNAVVVSPGRLDRSPCGTGTSARLAVLHARGLIEVGEVFEHRSVIDSVFTSRIESTTSVGDCDAVVPVIAGQAWITELSQVGLDPSDPFPAGFTVSDTWITEL